MTDSPDPYRVWDAAYVLGALSPEERRAFERHLADCPRCSAAVAELAGMPGILSALTAADAGAAGEPADALPQDAHQPTDVQRLAAAARVERRRARRLFGVAAGVMAVVLLAAGIAVGGMVLAPQSEDATSSNATVADVLEMDPLVPGTLTADLTVTSKKWGTLLTWECRYGDAMWPDVIDGAVEAAQYALVVTKKDGTLAAVATWQAAGDRAGGLTAATSIPTEDIESVEIRSVPGYEPLARTTL